MFMKPEVFMPLANMPHIVIMSTAGLPVSLMVVLPAGAGLGAGLAAGAGELEGLQVEAGHADSALIGLATVLMAIADAVWALDSTDSCSVPVAAQPM